MRPNLPSATARMVARGLAYIAHVPRFASLVSPEALALTSVLLTACAPSERRVLALLKRPGVRRLVAFVEARVAPGILVHYALRKRYLEGVAEQAIAEGFKQIVVMGAGLDTLALRQHRRHTNVQFIEIDHPATQQCKRLGIHSGDVPAPGPNLHFIAADLTERSLPDVLRDCFAYDMRADTLFLAEGVLMYLTSDAVGRLFESVGDTGYQVSRCRFAFTFLELQKNGKPDFDSSGPVLGLWLRLRGEPFRWGVRAADLPALLAEYGFSVAAPATPAELRARYLDESTAPSRTNGDLICVAEQPGEKHSITGLENAVP